VVVGKACCISVVVGTVGDIEHHTLVAVVDTVEDIEVFRNLVVVLNPMNRVTNCSYTSVARRTSQHNLCQKGWNYSVV
jgi:hypothetical protein